MKPVRVLCSLFLLTSFWSSSLYSVELMSSDEFISDEWDYVYLDCSEEIQGIDKRRLLLRILPDEGMSYLDTNLEWTGPQMVDLDEYQTYDSLNMFFWEIDRETMVLSLDTPSGRYEKIEMEGLCSVIPEEEVGKEIQSMIETKKSKQKI